jgi:chromosome partitioning protein
MSALKTYRIAVCHQKGGVAKTTTVSSLGASFAERGWRTLLIDLDPAGNLTTGLGFSPARAQKSAADVLLGTDTLKSVIQPTMVAGLDLVPSNADMLTVSRFLYLRPQYEKLLRNCFEQDSPGDYQFVVMDCPPTLGPLAVTALSAADLALIPTQCEYYSLQALEGVFGVIKNARAKANPQLIYRILVTMYDRRGLLHTRVLGHIQERLSGALLETMIGFDSKLRESQMFGVPVTIHASGTRAAYQYRALAAEIYNGFYSHVETQNVPQAA